MSQNLFSKFAGLSKVLAVTFMLVFIAPLNAYAAISNAAPSGKVSFTFDEGYDSTRTQAAPTLAKYGFSGTAYITTGCVGMVTVPNTCRANNDAKYITWDQIAQLKNQYGWEIGAHTKTHPYLASFDASDGQPNKISIEQVRQELTGSNADLAARGYDARSFASPYGDYDMPVLAEIAKLYETHRGFADTGYNTWPNSEYIVKVQQVQAGVSVNQVKQYIDAASANKQWLVLVFHDIKTLASSNPDDYEYSTRNLDQIAAYVKTKNLPVVNPANAVVKSDTNLLPNGSFNSGIAGGWRTDSANSVVSDVGNNGSYPDPSKSIKFLPSTRNSHLFSPNVSVNPSVTYMMKNFINVQSVTSGELGFYIDEYDASGNWISGQWKGAEKTRFVENYNFSYKPTSSSVSTASLQIYTNANSGITAYLDNVQWFPLTETAPQPPVQNLMPNGEFDQGITSGWRTDSASNVKADNTNNGGPLSPLNSVKFTGSAQNIHLFSPQISLAANKTYNVSSYANIKKIAGGELGFYIDEYDAAGNWISGQWKTARYSVSAGNIVFNYTPSSASVSKASLQIYVTANSGIEAYLDNIVWKAL